MLQNNGKKQRGLITALFLLSVVGLADAIYLSIDHIRGVVPSCSVVHGCEEVLTSDYATIGPIPLAFFGAIYYVLLFLLLIYYFDSKKKSVLLLVGRLSVIGVLVSIVLLGVQVFVIEAFCFYCLLSATTSSVLFIVSFMLYGRKIFLILKLHF